MEFDYSGFNLHHVLKSAVKQLLENKTFETLFKNRTNDQTEKHQGEIRKITFLRRVRKMRVQISNVTKIQKNMTARENRTSTTSM